MKLAMAMILLASIACSRSSDGGSQGGRPTWPDTPILAGTETMTAQLAESLMTRCRLMFYLKHGMTNQEANEAIDDGYQKFLDCLRTRGRIRDTATSG